MAKTALRLVLVGIFLLMTACAPLASTATPLPPNLTPTSLPVTPAPTSLPAALVSGLDETLANLAQQDLFSGSVLVAQKGQVLLSQGYGWADRGQKIPNTPHTRFHLGSVTKQFTAMAIMMLEAQGKLDVKDLICKTIPACPAGWSAITIHELLTHSSGIPDLFAVANWPEIRATPATPLQTMALFMNKPLYFQPGTSWKYSNSGYLVLGYIIEQVSGQSYGDFLQRSIFTPLKMHDTSIDNRTDGQAVGYPDRFTKTPAAFVDMSVPFSAGGLYSTVEDLFRWEQALSTEQLIPKAYLDEMFKPQVVIPNAGGAAYGYGWFIGTENEHAFIMHDGSIDGFANELMRYPNDQVTIIVLSNTLTTDVGMIEQILSQKVFGTQ
jgi:CubicO group peptidase (beta-lactamase class C family)